MMLRRGSQALEIIFKNVSALSFRKYKYFQGEKWSWKEIYIFGIAFVKDNFLLCIPKNTLYFVFLQRKNIKDIDFFILLIDCVSQKNYNKIHAGYLNRKRIAFLKNCTKE